jgi:hypothetical protein
VKQPPLPPLNDPYRQKIRFETRPRETATDEPRPEVHPLIAFEQDAANRISVPAEGELTHPLVLKTERLLKRAKRDANGLIASPTGALQVHTSRLLHERALRIMRALLTAFGARRFAILPTAEGIRRRSESGRRRPGASRRQNSVGERRREGSSDFSASRRSGAGIRGYESSSRESATRSGRSSLSPNRRTGSRGQQTTRSAPIR